MQARTAAMAPETSTQTDTRGEAVSPVTSTATSAPPLPHHEQHQHQHQQPPVQEHFAPAMPSTAQHVDHRGSAAIPQQPHQPYVLYPASYGEHYVPYEQSRQADMLRQGHAQGAQVVAPRIIVPETKSWRMTKDVLHVLAMVMSIAGIGIGISLASNSYSGLMGTLVSVPIVRFLPNGAACSLVRPVANSRLRSLALPLFGVSPR